MICSLGGPLSHGSPVVVFFDRGHPRFWNFYSTIPVDVFRVKSYMNCLFDSARVVMRVMINKLYFVPEWLVFVLVGWLDNATQENVFSLCQELSRIHVRALGRSRPVFYVIIFEFLSLTLRFTLT